MTCPPSKAKTILVIHCLKVISPPLFELTYTDKDNLELNKKMVKAFKKIYQPLNHKISINQKLKDKIKIGFISEFFTDHTIGKLFKNLIFSLDLKFFDTVVLMIQWELEGVTGTVGKVFA